MARAPRRSAIAALALGALVAACGGGEAERAAVGTGASPGAAELGVYDEIGGDFELTDQRRRPFRLSATRGKVRLLFFGYTMCPDVCPMTLSKVVRIRELLGAGGDEVMTLFVSVDPARDTPEKLRAYLRYFDLGDAAALTGTREEIDAVVDLFKATYEIEQADSAASYLVSHTSRLFLIDRRGKVRALFATPAAPGEIATAIRQVLAER